MYFVSYLILIEIIDSLLSSLDSFSIPTFDIFDHNWIITSLCIDYPVERCKIKEFILAPCCY